MLLIAVKLILNDFVQELFFKTDGTDRFQNNSVWFYRFFAQYTVVM